MENEILVILMVAFGLFAIVMFILFFIYLKRYYNNKHLDDDYQKDIDRNIDEEINNQPKEVVTPVYETTKEQEDLEFVPIKKK